MFKVSAQIRQIESSLILPDDTVERVFTGGHFLEGPAAAPDGSIYFSDLIWTFKYAETPGKIPAGTIFKYNPGSGQTTVFRSPSGMSNGITFSPKGQMYVAEGADYGGRCIVRTDLSTGLSYIAAGKYRDRPLTSPNDLVSDSKGRIYFTDPRYLGHESIEQPVQGVYRLDPDGKVQLIAVDAGKPNGITISPDEKTIYIASLGSSETDILDSGVLPGRSILEALLVYDLHPDGTITFRKILVDFSTRPEKYGPDGITTDKEGNIVAAQADWPHVLVFSPDGKELGKIPVPEGPCNVEFGRGEESNVLYIAAWTSLYRVRTTLEGWHFPVLNKH
jgi:gluconolactonase